MAERLYSNCNTVIEMAVVNQISAFRYRIICYILLNIVFSCSILCVTPTFTRFSSKTPYAMTQTAVAAMPVIVNELYNLKDVKGMTCSAVHLNAVLRHGARFPSSDDIDDISSLHKKIVAVMDPNLNPDLNRWVSTFARNESDMLSPLGEDEQDSLGRRTAQKFSTLFAGKGPNNYGFMVTNKDRTKQSASAFSEGFASAVNGSSNTSIAHGVNYFDSKVNDGVLRFYSSCANYISSVADNKTALKEYYDFLSSDKVTKIKQKIQDKLNIKNDTLTAENVELIYTICGFETGLYNSSSPWCSLLDESDVEILEFLDDLENYYENGYGYNITWQQSCPLVSKIFLTMDKIIMDIKNNITDGFLVGQFAFGHAETLGPLYAALGLFKDSEPLRADNYDKQKNRFFRSTEILPFSANLMFILYECAPEGNKTQAADYYLKLFVNEKPQLIPGCQDLYCPYQIVRKRYSDFVDHCNFKAICTQSGGKDSSGPVSRPLKEIYFLFLFLLWNLLF